MYYAENGVCHKIHVGSAAGIGEFNARTFFVTRAWIDQDQLRRASHKH